MLICLDVGRCKVTLMLVSCQKFLPSEGPPRIGSYTINSPGSPPHQATAAQALSKPPFLMALDMTQSVNDSLSLSTTFIDFPKKKLVTTSGLG